MQELFRCPVCHVGLEGWPPVRKCPQCGHSLPEDGGILVFTDDPSLKLEGERVYVGYDGLAEGYSKYLYSEDLASQLYPGYAKTIASLLEPDATVLNLACGPGHMDVELVKHGPWIVCGDISTEMLRIVASQLDGLKGSIIPARMNAYELPFVDHALDAVVCLQLLCFVSDPDAVMREIKRVLKPNGVFITDAPLEHPMPKNCLTLPTRLAYAEELKKRGVTEISLIGWNHGGCHPNAASYFKTAQVIETDDLVFDFRVTAGQFLKALESRCTSYQAPIDLDVHKAAIAAARDRIEAEYGPDCWDTSYNCRWVNRVTVMRD